MAIDKAASRRFRARIREILNRDWNPIGVDDLPEDEYDAYGGKVAAMIIAGALDEELAAYLTWAEAENMGLGKVDRARPQRVIVRLRAIGRMH